MGAEKAGKAPILLSSQSGINYRSHQLQMVAYLRMGKQYKQQTAKEFKIFAYFSEKNFFFQKLFDTHKTNIYLDHKQLSYRCTNLYKWAILYSIHASNNRYTNTWCRDMKRVFQTKFQHQNKEKIILYQKNRIKKLKLKTFNKWDW